MSHRRKLALPLLSVLVVVGTVFAFTWRDASAQGQGGNQHYPVFSNVGAISPQLQLALQAGTNPNPGTGNTQPVYLFAQMVRNTSTQPPFNNQPETITAFTVTARSGSQAFSQACVGVGTNEVLCTLSPAGPTWVAGPPLVARVQASDAAGFVITQQVLFRIF